MEPAVSAQDFTYTKFITTLAVIVPASSEDEFKNGVYLYTDNVIPGSAKKLKVPEKDGLTIWYFFVDLGKSISLTSKLRKSQLMKRKKRMRKVEGKRRRETLLQFKNSWKRPERKRSSQRNSNSNQDFQTNEDEKDKNLS